MREPRVVQFHVMSPARVAFMISGRVERPRNTRGERKVWGGPCVVPRDREV